MPHQFSNSRSCPRSRKKKSESEGFKKYKVKVKNFKNLDKQKCWYLKWSPEEPSMSEMDRKIDDFTETLGGKRECDYELPRAYKPVIYLYPKNPQEVLVQLDYQGELAITYPNYNSEIHGWKVTAYPDGHLINSEDEQEYSYLFWEGKNYKGSFDLSTGFVVEGNKTKDFLQNILKKIGLTPKEYNEFIVYWLPKMEDNAYNLIHFAGEEYTQQAPLKISPQPDSLLRVFMVYKPLPEFMVIPEQKLEAFSRNGFSVVEWGGTELR